MFEGATVGSVTEPDPDPRERRSKLVGLKLRALVRDHLGDDSVAEPVGFAPGAALLHGDVAWVLLDDRPADRLGAALVWATRVGARSLQVIAEAGTGVLARRAEAFSIPVSVWRSQGRLLTAAAPSPLPVSAPAPPAHEAMRELIIAGGATPLVEHGVLFGEVRGLEVCRVVDDPFDRAVRLEVGVGAHDREAFQMLHGDVPTVESLARIVEAVALQRRVDASPHPLNRLAAERFVRWRIEQDPDLVGAVAIRAVPPPLPRLNLKDPTPCVAAGTDRHGRAIVVVCSTGVELDLVPFAADARSAVSAADPGVGAGVRLVLVTPARDRVKVTDEIAGLLRQPAEFSAPD